MLSQVQCQLITHYASTGNVQNLKEIIERTNKHGDDRCGPNTFFSSFNGKHISPLITAVRKGNLKVVKYLVGKPVCLELNKKYMIRQLHPLDRDVCEWTTPLFEACYSSNIAVVKLLIELGADVNMSSFAKSTFTDSQRVSTPLIEAATLCDLNLIKLLIYNGAKLENTDSLGNTAIIQCVTSSDDSLECFEFFVDRGCDIYHKTF